MFKAALQLLTDLAHDLFEAVRWVFSPDAWRIILVVVASIGIVAALGYVAVTNHAYTREVFARCPGSRNLVFVAEFFTFTFFSLFSLAAVGEMMNWVDAKRRGDGPGSLNAFFAYAAIAVICGGTALGLLIRCA